MEKLALVKERKFDENISMSFDFIKANFANTKKFIVYLVIISVVAGLLVLIPSKSAEFLSSIVTGIGSLLVVAYVTSYMKSYVNSADGSFNKEEVVAGVKEHFLFIFLASLLYGLCVGIGMILLVIPGLFIAVACSFYAFCIVNDNLTIMDGLKKSYALVKDNWFITLGYLLVVGLVLGIISIIFYSIGAIFLFMGSIGAVISTFILTVVSLTVSLITYFAVGVYYYSLVDKKEGVHAASQIDSIGQND